MIATFTPLVALALFAACWWVLRDWGLMALRWKTVTPLKCRRYLVAKGWRFTGDNLDGVDLEKNGLRILVDCISSERATVASVQLATEDRMIDGRHFVIVVPDSLEPGLVDEMLSRKVSVVPYTQLYRLDSILAAHRTVMNKFAADEQRMLTNRLDAPTPAKLLPPITDEIIAETERVQCFFRGAGTDTLVIAFNDSWRSGPDGRLHPNIDMADLGFSILDIVTREPNWFPADDMAALIPAVLEKLEGRFPKRVTLGFSQGGYGAIKFSSALGATTSIAFSPQFSIDPRIVGELRYTDAFRSHLNVGMAIRPHDCTCSAFMFYDPYDGSDQRQAECLAEQVQVSAIPLPFAGHSTARLFETRERLCFVVATARTGDVAKLTRFGLSLRHENGDRAWLMALHLAETKPLLGLRLSEAWWDRWQAGQKPHVAFRLAGKGYADAVLGLMEKLAAEWPDDAEVQGGTALVALEARQAGRALPYAARARELLPQSLKWKHAVERAKALDSHMAA